MKRHTQNQPANQPKPIDQKDLVAHAHSHSRGSKKPRKEIRSSLVAWPAGKVLVKSENNSGTLFQKFKKKKTKKTKKPKTLIILLMCIRH